MSDFYDGVPEPSEQLDQLENDRSLLDRGVDDPLDEGYTTPERWSPVERYGEEETLDQRLAEEEPDDNGLFDEAEDDDEFEDDEDIEDREVGDQRAGRLVAPDLGVAEDEESDLVGEDVGIDGAAASAEEAAVHIMYER
jgi:hypothetical protein